MRTNTATAIDYKAAVEKATADKAEARAIQISTQNRVMYAEMDVAAIEAQLADAKRKLKDAKKDDRAASKAWTEADHRLKVAETELLLKQPTLAKIDEWVNQLQNDWKASGTPLVFTRQSALELRLSIEELCDYHTYLMKVSESLITFLPKEKYNCYTAKTLARDIILMLEHEETRLIYSCSLGKAKNENSEEIDCGF